MNSSMTKNQGNGLSGRNGSNFRRISLSNGFEDHDFFLSNKRNIDRRGGRTDEINGDRSTSASCDTWRNGYVDGGKAGLAGNNFVLRRTAASTTGIVPGRNSANPSTIVRRKRRESLLGEDLSSRLLLEDSSASDSTNFGKSQRPTRNPFSVSNFLREGLSAARKSERKPNEESILKRSSTFLANLTHTASKYKERSTRETSPRLVHSQSSAKGYSSILNNVSDGFASLRRSPSVQTLPVQRRRKNTGRVKKSVSFSSDTSFEEKRVPYRKVPVHEVKIYHKGVLQDRSTRETIPIAKVPSSWETNSSEGRTALLGAAREADDVALEEIVSQVRTFGLGDVDVNAVDSSGRTALSYMAGNGASTMLDLALSFDGVDPNIPDNEGNTPLHFAAQAGQTECLNILLQRCPDIEVDARNASGFTPLMKAALQGRTKCAKILLFAGANPTLRDHGRGLRAEQWARFCGRYVCAEVIERFARHRLLERSTTCRWGSEPELAAKMLQGKIMPIPNVPLTPPCSGLRSKIRKVFRTTSSPDRNFSLVSQLTSAALCASSPALPKASDVPPVVKSLLRPLSVPQLRVTLVPQPDFLDQSKDRYGSNSSEKIENAVNKITRSKKKSK